MISLVFFFRRVVSKIILSTFNPKFDLNWRFSANSEPAEKRVKLTICVAFARKDREYARKTFVFAL